MAPGSNDENSRGFTLIELLVVMAIIAILASLLLPSLRSAKSAAHNTICQGRLRQLALAVSLYVTDHGHYPKHYYYPSAEDTGGPFQLNSFQNPVRWSDALHRYTTFRWDGTLYKCPEYTGGTWLDPHNPASAFGSYGYNAFGASADGLDLLETGGWLRESAVLHPSDMIALGDSQIGIYRHLIPNGIAVGLDAIRFDFPEPDSSEDGQLRRKVMNGRHRGKVNMVFADAHIEHGRPARFHGGDRASMRWSRDNRPMD